MALERLHSSHTHGTLRAVPGPVHVALTVAEADALHACAAAFLLTIEESGPDGFDLDPISLKRGAAALTRELASAGATYDGHQWSMSR